MYECIRTGNHIVRTGISIFPYFELGKNLKLIDHWEASGRAADTSGRIQAGTVASRYSRGPDGKCTLFRRMILGLTGVHKVRHVVQTNGIWTGWLNRPDD
jgi:hypothetical protein